MYMYKSEKILPIRGSLHFYGVYAEWLRTILRILHDNRAAILL